MDVHPPKPWRRRTNQDGRDCDQALRYAGSEGTKIAGGAGAALAAACVVGAALEARAVGDATHAEGADIRTHFPGAAADSIAVQRAAFTAPHPVAARIHAAHAAALRPAFRVHSARTTSTVGSAAETCQRAHLVGTAALARAFVMPGRALTEAPGATFGPRSAVSAIECPAHGVPPAFGSAAVGLTTTTVISGADSSPAAAFPRALLVQAFTSPC